MPTKDNRLWDARLAHRLVYPFKDSALSPNHLTTLRLLFGLAACAGLATGDYLWSNLGALCFVLSNFLDHTDGELARLGGKTSRFGHYYDLASDAAVNILLFCGIGIGLMQGKLGGYALPLGCLAGVSVAAIFYMRMVIEDALGKDAARQPELSAVAAEDILYLLPLVSLLHQLELFLLLAGIGAPLFALWVLRDYLALDRQGP